MRVLSQESPLTGALPTRGRPGPAWPRRRAERVLARPWLSPLSRAAATSRAPGVLPSLPGIVQARSRSESSGSGPEWATTVPARRLGVLCQFPMGTAGEPARPRDPCGRDRSSILVKMRKLRLPRGRDLFWVTQRARNQFNRPGHPGVPGGTASSLPRAGA